MILKTEGETTLDAIERAARIAAEHFPEGSQYSGQLLLFELVASLAAEMKAQQPAATRSTNVEAIDRSWAGQLWDRLSVEAENGFIPRVYQERFEREAARMFALARSTKRG